MKIEYEPKTFRAASLKIIEQADEILHDYEGQGYTLTLRQLYYRFVATGILENTERNYKRLGSIISDARLAGLIDWNHMTDRTREVVEPSTWANPQSILHACSRSYAIDRWKDQDHRIEVWVEKDALVEVIGKACDPYQVPYFSCRGYTSQSAMWQASLRFESYFVHGKDPVMIHLGDHDPSGIDMTRDIIDRMELFLSEPLHVKRIALNMGQIDKYKPPPNPTKMTDSRAEGYVDKFGFDSWELDALEPRILTALIRKTIKQHLDQDAWAEALERESKDIDYLKELAERRDDG